MDANVELKLKKHTSPFFEMCDKLLRREDLTEREKMVVLTAVAGYLVQLLAEKFMK